MYRLGRGWVEIRSLASGIFYLKCKLNIQVEFGFMSRCELEFREVEDGDTYGSHQQVDGI